MTNNKGNIHNSGQKRYNDNERSGSSNRFERSNRPPYDPSRGSGYRPQGDFQRGGYRQDDPSRGYRPFDRDLSRGGGGYRPREDDSRGGGYRPREDDSRGGYRPREGDQRGGYRQQYDGPPRTYGRDENPRFERPRSNYSGGRSFDKPYSGGQDRGGFSKPPYRPSSGGRFQSSNPRFSKSAPRPPFKRFEERVRLVSDLQITDGKHRGKYIDASPSPKVGTSNRKIRELMFKTLYRRVRAKRFLDLYSGIGSTGLEAISRGALVCSFVERSARNAALIKKNMEKLEISEGHGEVFNKEVVPFLKQMSKRRRYWDVVLVDPPTDGNYEEVLKHLQRGRIVAPRGMLVLKHPYEMFFPEQIGCLRRWRVIVDGDTSLSFYERI